MHARFIPRPMTVRLAVCIAGEQRSASCSHNGVSPIESAVRFITALGERSDVYVVLDTPPTAEDERLAGVGTAVGPSLRASASRLQLAFDKLKPVAIEYEDARAAVESYWQHVQNGNGGGDAAWYGAHAIHGK